MHILTLHVHVARAITELVWRDGVRVTPKFAVSTDTFISVNETRFLYYIPKMEMEIFSVTGTTLFLFYNYLVYARFHFYTK